MLWVLDATHDPTAGGADDLALRMDLDDRLPEAVIHYSDDDLQYTPEAFRNVCDAFRVRMLIGRLGKCYDNAMAESFVAMIGVCRT